MARAPWLTQGYLRDPANSEKLWLGGWLHTGDIGVIGPDGYLKITDRLKDVIKTGGEWVSSLDIEDLILRHPGVSEAQAKVANAQGVLARNNEPQIGVTRQTEASVGVAATAPIYQGGGEYAAVRQSKEVLGQTRIQMDVTREQVRALIACGIEEGQGYIVSPPLPFAKFDELVEMRKSRADAQATVRQATLVA